MNPWQTAGHRAGCTTYRGPGGRPGTVRPEIDPELQVNLASLASPLAEEERGSSALTVANTAAEVSTPSPGAG